MFWTRKNFPQNKFLITFVLPFITLLSLNLLNCAPDEKIFEKVHGVFVKDMKAIEQLTNETDITYFAYYYRKNSTNSKLGAEMLVKISEKLRYLATIMMIDCDMVVPQDTPMCKKDPDAPDGYPKMEIYVPPEYKINPYTKKSNPHMRRMYNTQEVSENLIYNFITQHIPARTTKLNSDNFEHFASNSNFNKVILFTDKTKTPLLFRGISNYFYDRLIFGEVNKDQTALLKKFKISKFPTLLVYQTHEDGVPLDEPLIQYYDKEINSGKIAEFIDQYALEEPLNKKTAKEAADPSIKNKPFFKKLSLEEAVTYMEKFPERKYVVLLTNKEEVPEGVNKFNSLTRGFFHFIQINCSNNSAACQSTFKGGDNTNPRMILYKDTSKSVAEKLKHPGISLSFDYPSIEQEIYRHYEGELKEANPSTFSALTNEAVIMEKVPFIYFHSGEVPLSLFLISTLPKYKQIIDFIVFENPNKEIVSSLKLTKLPQLLIMLKEEGMEDRARIMTYNDDMGYLKLSLFINQYFATSETKPIEKEEVEEKQDITFINDKAALVKNCIKNKKLCVIGFLDGRTNKDSMKQFDNSIKILENVALSSRKKNHPASYGWVNATCQVSYSVILIHL